MDFWSNQVSPTDPRILWNCNTLVSEHLIVIILQLQENVDDDWNQFHSISNIKNCSISERRELIKFFEGRSQVVCLV